MFFVAAGWTPYYFEHTGSSWTYFIASVSSDIHHIVHNVEEVGAFSYVYSYRLVICDGDNI